MTGSYIALIAGTLIKTCVAESAGFRLEDVRCGCGRSTWSSLEQTSSYTIVFVRRGCFRRRVDGVESVLDPVTAYLERPGEAQQIAHPADGGDSCTQLLLPPDFVPEASDARVRFTRPQVDLAHRLLLRVRWDDDVEFVDRAVALADEVLQQQPPPAGARRRLTTAEARRRVVDRAREAIALDPTLDLVALARIAAVSAHHLSRTFRAETGETVSRYRNRVRTRLVLERLAEGDDRLARLAAELGFSDQAHLARVVRQELGRTPSSLRAALASNCA